VIPAGRKLLSKPRSAVAARLLYYMAHHPAMDGVGDGLTLYHGVCCKPATWAAGQPELDQVPPQPAGPPPHNGGPGGPFIGPAPAPGGPAAPLPGPGPQAGGRGPKAAHGPPDAP